MESQYDPITYMDAWSYQRRYFDTLEKYFPEAGERVEIYIGSYNFLIYIVRENDQNFTLQIKN